MKQLWNYPVHKICENTVFFNLYTKYFRQYNIEWQL